MTWHKKVQDFKLKTFVKLIGILLTSVFMKIFNLYKDTNTVEERQQEKHEQLFSTPTPSKALGENLQCIWRVLYIHQNPSSKTG
jgi:hypothetical protein